MKKQEKVAITVVVGTTREGRVGRKVAGWYLKTVKELMPEVEFSLLDLADENLPIFNEAVPPLYHQYSPLQEKVAKKVAAADGFVFVTAEYNRSVPSSLKNFLEYVNAEWHHKPAAFVGYGGTGAVRTLEHLSNILTELRVVSVRDQVVIHTVWEALDESDHPKAGYVLGDVQAQLNELLWWTHALKEAREKTK